MWEALERHWQPRRARDGGVAQIYLAQAQSNRGVGGRKKDFPDAERLVKRLVAQELTLSFVPDVEQRLWRTVMRCRYQLTRNHVQLQNRLEALLEAHLKLSSLVSDLLGTSARRTLQAVADGATTPADAAALADQRLRATPEQLADALDACTTLHPVYRRLLTLTPVSTSTTAGSVPRGRDASSDGCAISVSVEWSIDTSGRFCRRQHTKFQKHTCVRQAVSFGSRDNA